MGSNRYRRRSSIVALSDSIVGHKQLNNGRRTLYLESNSFRRGGHPHRQENLPDPNNYCNSSKYTIDQLDCFADAFLWQDIKAGNHIHNTPAILMMEHMQDRRKREIYVPSGIPDESITNNLSPDGQTMYWRTHPQGRRVASDERRKDGSSYYL